MLVLTALSHVLVYLFIKGDATAREEQTLARGPRKAYKTEDHGCGPHERVLLAPVPVAKSPKMRLELHNRVARKSWPCLRPMRDTNDFARQEHTDVACRHATKLERKSACVVFEHCWHFDSDSCFGLCRQLLKS